jgi:hypothetical protein
MLISCNKMQHCYKCTAIDSVFDTGYPDSMLKKTLLRLDTIYNTECFESRITSDSLFTEIYWEGKNKLILCHKKTINCK